MQKGNALVKKRNALVKKWLSTANKVDTPQKVYRLCPGHWKPALKQFPQRKQARETDVWKTHLLQRGETAKRVVPKPELSSARRRAGHSRGSGPSKEGLF